MRTVDAFVTLTLGLASDACALASESARANWRRADVLEFGSLDELEAHPWRGESELVLLGPGVPAEERSRAAAVSGADGLPRWPVLVWDDGISTEGLWFVPGALQSVAGLSYVMRAAVTHHATVRECRRAHGDLWTIARRISHEIRSPIGCILTSADVIREEMEDLVPAAGALAQPVTDSAREVMDLVERLTVIARASASRPVPVTVEMGLIVWAARERLMTQIEAANAEIIEATDWPDAIGRPEWLEQVWLNLLSNALRHGGPRPRIELGWKHRDGETLFFVRDHGPGVGADVLPALLRPFHLLHQHDSCRGLGLAMVQRLVELQGGRTGYEPVTPHGALFFFTLPAPADRPRRHG